MFVNANKTPGKSDNESISLAIVEAKRMGKNKVVVPKHNERTDSDIWVIEDTVYLPNDIEILIDNAHLVLADNVYCNMFANAYVSETRERTLADEQYGITIRGEGNAVLDGGNYNSLSERNSEKDGRPHISKNTTLLFVNCRNVTVENISITNQRWWGITNIFVRDSYFGNLCIRSDYSRFADGVLYPGEEPRNYDEIYIKNSDGIDLRVGCNNILIENITGYAEDDMIALTALGGFEKRLGYYVSDKDDDISDVTIKNITADSSCSLIRLLCNHGKKVYNVIIDGVNDTKDEKRIVTAPYAIRISDKKGRYQAPDGCPMRKGDIKNITVRNVVSKCKYAVALYNELCDITVENVTAINGLALVAPWDEECVVEGLCTQNIRSIGNTGGITCGRIIRR